MGRSDKNRCAGREIRLSVTSTAGAPLTSLPTLNVVLDHETGEKNLQKNSQSKRTRLIRIQFQIASFQLLWETGNRQFQIHSVKS